MTLDGVMEHQEAFQAIADANDDPYYPGTRAAGTEGYDESVEYVAGLLEDAGYDVTLDPVDVTFNFPAVLRQLTPTSSAATWRASGTSMMGECESWVTAKDVDEVEEQLEARRRRVAPRLARVGGRSVRAAPERAAAHQLGGIHTACLTRDQRATD